MRRPTVSRTIETGPEHAVIRSHIHLHAKTGRRKEVLSALDRLEVLTAAREQPGFLGAEVQVSVDDRDDLLVWSSWASHEHYERWLGSPPYEQMLREIAEFVAETPELHVYRVVDAAR